MKKTKATVDVTGMFSRLIVERARNSYEQPVIWIRWGSATAPVIEVRYAEALALSEALRQVAPNQQQ